MDKVLLTGYNSFTGPYIVNALEARGADVYGLSTSAIAGNDKVFVANFSDFDVLKSVFETVKPTHIIDLAGVSFVGHGEPLDFFHTNVIQKETLYKAIHTALPGLKRLIVVSSATVCGNRDNPKLSEDLLPKPRNHYGLSKAGLEMVGANWKEQLPVLITRPFNYTGADQHPRFLVPKIVSHFRDRKAEIELGNIDVFRDFSDVRDVAEIYADLLFSNAPSGEIFNICSGQLQSLRGIIEMCSEITGHEIQIQVNPAFVRKDEIVKLGGSAEKLKTVSKNVSKTAFKETLRWMLDYESNSAS